MMISCPACAKPKSNAPHPQNNEHTFSRPADTAYTREEKKKKIFAEERSASASREKRKREREKEDPHKLREKKRPSVESLSQRRERETHAL
jgi:hypothetical protein